MFYHNLDKSKNYNDINSLENIIAVLGPTNTGKTYYAIEQMLKYDSGIIGCPLRLLAREIYDKLVKKRGILNIALITGEEKIVPTNAKYFVCTVEAMPKNLDVDFVAIDEVQLTAHSERGHVFTDKLLNVRGNLETMFLGSDNIENLLKKIYPKIYVKKFKRFSSLEYVGSSKLSKMPPRSAIVTFSVNEVYEIAELVKRRHGGTAVVLGALSPKTRNAQVELYESGEVDYLVATDAIGMGLNMNINHVAFAKLIKYDGKNVRSLTSTEAAQIAGRAGRYKKDGTFGVTAGCNNFNPLMVNAIENHSFSEIDSILWRNSKLDFSSIKSLLRSLSKRSEKNYFIMSSEADDEKFLKVLSKKVDNENVRLLWEVCSVPDYGKNYDDSHFLLLENIYKLLRENGELPEIWASSNLNNLNNIKGELDLLATRLANVRTWNYIFNKKNWIHSDSELGSKAKYIENRLSDALHKGLVERFVDYKMASFSKSLKVNNDLISSISRDNSVKIEGYFVGKLEGLTFINEVSKNQDDKKEIFKIVRKVIATEVGKRVRIILNSHDQEISFDKNLCVFWQGCCIAKLYKGKSILKPKILLVSSELLNDKDRLMLKERLYKFLHKYILNIISPINNLMNKCEEGALKGLLYQLKESLGVIKISNVRDLVVALSIREKNMLGELGIEIGQFYIWSKSITNKKNSEFLWKLLQIDNGYKVEFNYPDINKPVSCKNIPFNLFNKRELILIDNYIYNIQLIERIMKSIKNFLMIKNIIYLNKKNIKLINKKYNLSYQQIRSLLIEIGFKKDKTNPVKYFYNQNKFYKSNILLNKDYTKNSPFAVLAKF